MAWRSNPDSSAGDPSPGPTSAPQAPPSPTPPPPSSSHLFDETDGWPEVQELAAAVEGGDPEPMMASLLAITDPITLESRIWTAATFLTPGPALDQWVVRHHDESAVPWAVRGVTLVRAAWDVRGSGWAKDVQGDAWAAFHDMLRAADAGLLVATRRFPDDPQPWTPLLAAGMGLSIPKGEQAARHERAVATGHALPGADATYLQSICKKWGGSHEAMFEFARSASEAAPLGSLRHRLVITARYEHTRDLAEDDADAWKDTNAQAEVEAAASRFVEQVDVDRSWPALVALNATALDAWHFRLKDLCRRCHERIDGRYTRDPWGDYADPLDELRRCRRFAGLPMD